MMTFSEAMAMMIDGTSLPEIQKIAANRKAKAKPSNVVDLAEARAKRAPIQRRTVEHGHAGTGQVSLNGSWEINGLTRLLPPGNRGPGNARP